MKRFGGIRVWVAAAATCATFVACGSPARAGDRIGVYADFGVGGILTQPFIVGGLMCGTVGAGISARVARRATASFDFRSWSGSGDLFRSRIPEAANAGKQSLVTFLGGVELGPPGSHSGAFLSAGLGVGHSSISGARGPTDSPNFGFVPLGDRTAVAYGLGAGYRISGGPGPLHTQVALRTDGLLGDGMKRWAYATAVTLGFAW